MNPSTGAKEIILRSSVTFKNNLDVNLFLQFKKKRDGKSKGIDDKDVVMDFEANSFVHAPLLVLEDNYNFEIQTTDEENPKISTKELDLKLLLNDSADNSEPYGELDDLNFSGDF